MNWFQDKIKYCIYITVILFFLCGRELFAQNLSLNNLSDFKTSSGNWHITGNISANPLTEEITLEREGSGILAGSASPHQDVSSLVTKMEHGDLFLEFDAMLTPGASATIWLQGRYGLRLVDNWGSRKKNHDQNGSLVPPKANGVEAIGYGPRQQIGKAPGLWQHFKIMFNAPRFNEQGEKIKQAKLVFVEQNGVKIQEGQTLPGPSKGAISAIEVSEGPLEFRVKNGTVAFRNIEYTASSGHKIQVEDLSYRLFVDTYLDEEYFYGDGKDGPIQLPELDSEKPTDTGDIDQMHTGMTRDVGQDFALQYEGKLNIPQSGKYRFESNPNGKGAFWLAGDELFRWDVIHKKGTNNKTIELKEGTYDFKFLTVNFGNPKVEIFVDGPGIIKQPLHQLSKTPEGSPVRPIILKPTTEPLIQRSFVFYENQKLLNCINVGFPEGVHYSFNLFTGGLLQVWKGEFGDVTSMWHDRGLQQVLKPLGSVLTLSPEQQVLLSEMGNTVQDYGEFRHLAYDLNQKGEPVFQYRLGEINIRDHLTLGTQGRTLTRTLQFAKQGELSKSAWYRIIKGSNIEQVGDQLYAIDDKSYFIELEGSYEPEVREEGDKKALFVPINIDDTKPESLSYSLIW